MTSYLVIGSYRDQSGRLHEVHYRTTTRTDARRWEREWRKQYNRYVALTEIKEVTQ